jgi:hypothetical protein
MLGPRVVITRSGRPKKVVTPLALSVIGCRCRCIFLCFAEEVTAAVNWSLPLRRTSVLDNL